MNSLILVSGSSYKQSLFRRLGVPFTSIDSRLDESPFKSKGLEAKELSQLLSKEKALSLRYDYPEATLIGADQVCHYKGKIFSKAGTRDQAFLQLKELQGQTHELITSYAILGENQVIEHTNITQLKMSALSDDEILEYLNYDKPFDCAGSYKIESGGIALFDEILCSDFTAIIGLPLLQLSHDLNSLGFKLWKS